MKHRIDIIAPQRITMNTNGAANMRRLRRKWRLGKFSLFGLKKSLCCGSADALKWNEETPKLMMSIFSQQ